MCALLLLSAPGKMSASALKEGSGQSPQYLLQSNHAFQVNLFHVTCLLHLETFPAGC